MIVINNRKIPVIALEGMPRSGKTSTLKQLAKEVKDGFFLKELYFTEQQLAELEDKKGTVNESKWFIDQEINRKDELNIIYPTVIIADRMYLSTLAYCFARSKLNKRPNEFVELAEYYNKKKHLFIAYDVVIIFDNEIETTQTDRRENKDAEDMEYWMNKEFMEYYRKFYLDLAKDFTNARIHFLNTKILTLNDIYTKVRNIVSV